MLEEIGGLVMEHQALLVSVRDALLTFSIIVGLLAVVGALCYVSSKPFSGEDYSKLSRE